ncbi:hypothetical protein [Hymenobacter psychrotolerans]|uniref:SpoIIAA-like n=1 Tax=Hymenobacter psychrotolerans DSM 18569 TaxID=1121959 RepID=A0A1M7GDN5_9BACT|nr:hypothetical protein [Hymenobacter psychrotolerans]SHM14286.1 hypothetical protein SAMN02746009_04021 [Hymenobacter psychrotolerans DSM 18569]
MNKLIYPAHESLYFHNRLAHVVELPGRYVRVEWLVAPMFSPDLRQVYEQTLLLLKEARLHKVLTDHQLLPAIMPRDREWLVHDWVPRAVREAQYRCCAIVGSQDMYARLAATHLGRQAHRHMGLQIAHFSDCAAAAHWLETTDA